jgi:4-hydroxy-tetrahydrodipicolinate reductase
MLFLVLGRGKTGSLVADVAAEHGHGVRVIGEEENRAASALTGPLLAAVDVVIDFTTPQAAVENLRACLANGAHVVVGTTGWYTHLNDLKRICERRHAGMVYGTNFSVGTQALFRATRDLATGMPGYKFSISETHHTGKLDAPSGTAITLKEILQKASPALEVEITSTREGDSCGIHVVEARSEDDVITLRHEAFSRRGFALGAVRAAEWLAGRTGCWNFTEIFEQLG